MPMKRRGREALSLSLPGFGKGKLSVVGCGPSGRASLSIATVSRGGRGRPRVHVIQNSCASAPSCGGAFFAVVSRVGYVGSSTSSGDSTQSGRQAGP